MFGYSLSFSRNGNWFIGSYDNFFLINVLDRPSEANEKIPDILFCIYQGKRSGSQALEIPLMEK